MYFETGLRDFAVARSLDLSLYTGTHGVGFNHHHHFHELCHESNTVLIILILVLMYHPHKCHNPPLIILIAPTDFFIHCFEIQLSILGVPVGGCKWGDG